MGEAGEGNLLVEGDNLHALKALLPYYGGKVKCIYIDPPYNTGNEGWIYNDNVNAPEIKRWLGQVVGKEAEDLSRHDKWLCMMYPRLVLLRQFLREDGAIFVSLDDNEISHARLVLDEIFGASCFVAELIWKSRQHLDSRSKTGISLDHEYILVYEKQPKRLRFRGRARDSSKYKNPDNDPRGTWMSRSILGLATKEQRPNLHYILTDPKTGTKYPCPPATGWRYSRETMSALIDEGRILFPKKPTGRPREKVFESNLQTAFTGFPSIIQDVFTDEGTAAVRAIFGEQAFSFPKPPRLVAELISQVATGQNDLVLDSFGGSGTTGHAVLQLNKEDGGNRRFILVEMEPKIARGITAERLRRVIAGYGETPGLGGGFRYCTLGEPLFDERGQIAAAVKFADLAHHVFFTETGEPLPKRPDKRTPLLGVHNGRARQTPAGGPAAHAAGRCRESPGLLSAFRFQSPQELSRGHNRDAAKLLQDEQMPLVPADDTIRFRRQSASQNHFVFRVRRGARGAVHRENQFGRFSERVGPRHKGLAGVTLPQFVNGFVIRGQQRRAGGGFTAALRPRAQALERRPAPKAGAGNDVGIEDGFHAAALRRCRTRATASATLDSAPAVSSGSCRPPSKR